MRWPAAGLWAAAGLLVLTCLAPLAHAQPVPAAPQLLTDALGSLDSARIATAWLDPQGNAGIEQAVQAAAAFQHARAGTMHQLGPDAALWMHLRLQRPPGERQAWLLKFPMPTLDHVTVFQQAPQGWTAETAGDTIAVARWPERGRYAFFRLELPPGQARDVYVRIQHEAGADFPALLATASAHNEQVQLEYLVLGAVFGAMLLLIVACAARSWVYRDPVFGWYGVYALLTSLAVASFTGVAPHLLWPGFGALRDAPTPMLACAAVGAGMLFVRTTLGLRRRLPVQDAAARAIGIAGLLLALTPALLPKSIHLPLVGVYMTAASVTAVLFAAAAWGRGDTVGRYVLAAQLPMVVAVVATVVRALGWADVPFVSQYLVVLGLAVEVPLMLVALFIRARDRHSAEVREQALSTQDALTGLLAPHLFQDRLRQVVARHRRDGESAAIVYIDLVNHARIRETFGGAAAEQSLLRSVIKLRRLLRDVDTVSRVGEARFGVILEGASSRASVTERAARLIAAGLMPLPGLKPDVTLQFHIAALLLNERALEADEVQAALSAQLARMSPRTRRPIRFIAPEQQTSDPPADSSIFARDLDPGGDPVTSARSQPGLTAVG
ncbi:7TM diverse intracellular signaling domain-containing protein [Ramlibacter sp. PS3R-8]|uniref:7TM diverse intracellular signaling domain-containing protein n=1 Tax=Ramlibacter sp. PS3R-8 TaxID=3133437 RepID=UPI0030B63F9F